MPIRLISGNPGSGKTLKVVGEIVAARNAGRRVYVHGLRDLATHDKDGNEIGWEPLADPMDWAKCATGSLIVIDEAQGPWPASRGEVPDAIRELSKHRHYGLDFLLTTQYPSFLMKYVRELVDDHQHHVRRFGTASAKVFRWQEGQEDVKSEAVRGRAEVSTWMFPAKLYGLYKSADAHTIKARIPRKLVFVALVGLLVLGLGGYAWGVAHHIGKPADAAGEDDAAAQAAPSSDGNGAHGKRPLTGEEFARLYVPRIPSQPWSAPAFQSLQPGLPPRVFCISSPDSCTCLTDQGSRYTMPMADCRLLARHGQWDPFEERRQQAQEANNAKEADLHLAPEGAETASPLGIRTEPSSVGGVGMGKVW